MSTKTAKKTAAHKPRKKPAEAPYAIPPENEVLVLRTCTKKDGKLLGYGGFPWPKSGPVHAPDKWDPAWGPKLDWRGGWEPSAECGAGLHGISDIFQDWSLLDWSAEGQAMIVAVDGTKMVRGSAKVRFQSGIVRKLVSLAEGLCSLLVTRKSIEGKVAEIAAEANEGNEAASGSYSRLAASGSYSRLAASGDDSRLAASGSSSRLAASGDDSRLAASGDSSRLAASGSYSRLAASGSYSRLAASGDSSTVMSAGVGSVAKAGSNGAIALAWHDGTRPRIAVGYVGEDGIEADTWYRVGATGKLEVAK